MRIKAWSEFITLFTFPSFFFFHQFCQTQVKCSVRGDLGPACNSAGMIDRDLLGIDHLYTKPVYRNLMVCSFIMFKCCKSLLYTIPFIWHNLCFLNVGMQHIQWWTSPTNFTLVVSRSFWSWRYFEVKYNTSVVLYPFSMNCIRMHYYYGRHCSFFFGYFLYAYLY